MAKEKVSIFIPVYNEEKIITKNTEKLLAFLERVKFEYEIVFGNNGSSDNTLKEVERLSKRYPKEIRYITASKRGIGNAFRQLIQSKKFHNVIMVDMDLSHDLNFITQAADLLDTNVDIVVGCKRNIHERRQWYRKLLSTINIIMCKIFLGLPYKDYGAGAKAYNKDFLVNKEHLIDDETFFTTRLVYAAMKTERKIKEIPVQVNDTRKSKFKLPFAAFYIAFEIIKLSILGK